MEVSDQELVRAALADIAHFDAIIERYKHPLMRYIRHLGVRDTHNAEDILQEVFIKVYQNLNAYDERYAFSSWIYRITHNETITFFRKYKIAPLSLEREAELETLNAVTREDPAFLFDRGDQEQYVHRAIDALDTKYKEVIILRYLEDKSYDEIADILKKPPGTIAILIRRAKEKLKALLPYHD